jgi:prepilin-type processing-associated H-X9-DG protein
MWPYLLSYVEEGNIPFDFTQQWNVGSNIQAVGVSIKLFRCPASPGPQYVNANNYATTDYAPLAGASSQLKGLSQSHGATQTFDSVGSIYPGFFNNINKDTDPASTIGDVTDGLSNTLMIVECAGRNDLWIGRQKNATAVLADDDNPDQSTNAAGKTTGGPWAQPRNQIIVFGFDSASKQLGGTDFINACNSGEVYSFHTNVANFAFGDGSVRTLAATIAPDTFISLVTRSGGEPVSAP